MRSSRNIHRPFTVEIVADAWAQVSHLPRDTYRAIQARLESLAMDSSAHAAPASDEPPDAVRSFRMGELTIHYVVDMGRHLIQLVGITRERSGPAVSGAQREESSG